MRVLALTSESERHMAFASACLKAFDDVAIGIEPKSGAPVKRRTILRTIKALAPRVKSRLISEVYSRRYSGVMARFWADRKAVERQYFGEVAHQAEKDVEDSLLFRVGRSERINMPGYVQKISDYKPDVILVMGTSLVSRRIIEQSRVASLNIHTGLSPYYRGSNTNFWPLVEERPEYCGVTVHTLTTGIDSGGIVAHARPEITADDSFFSINCKCIQLGIDAAIKTINKLDDEPLNPVPQWEPSRLYLNREFNARHVSKYYSLMNGGLLSRYAERLRAGQIEAPEIVTL